MDNSVEELQKQKADYKNKIDAINRYNPLSDGSDAQKRVLELLQKPEIQKIEKVMTSPAVVSGIDQVAHSPDRMTLLYVEIAWIFVVMILKIYRSSKPAGFWVRLWIAVSQIILFWSFALFVIPWAILGKPYIEILSAIYRQVMN